MLNLETIYLSSVMRLIELKINSDYKNLKGLKLRFNPQNNTYVIIGNNGSGKSSILEAISSIFSSLWYGNPAKFIRNL